MSIDETDFEKLTVTECTRTSLLAFGGGSLPFFSDSPSFLGSFSVSSVLAAESSTAAETEMKFLKNQPLCNFVRTFSFWSSSQTWGRRVGLRVSRGPGGRGFPWGVGLSRRLFALLQLGHPRHRPLAVHVLELLHLEVDRTGRRSEKRLMASILLDFLMHFKVVTFLRISDITPIRVSTCCLDNPSLGTPSAKVSAPSAPGSQR